MEINEVISEMTKIWQNILDDDAIELKSETTAKDVEGWDSLTNIQLIVAAEKKYKIRFSASEIMNFANVGEMAETIIRKSANA